MEIENPLLAPRLFWQVALAITAVLVMIRVCLYLWQRSRSGPVGAAEGTPPEELAAAGEVPADGAADAAPREPDREDR